MALISARVMIVNCGEYFAALYVNGELYAEGRKELLVRSLLYIINAHNIFEEASESYLNEAGIEAVNRDGFPTKLNMIMLWHFSKYHV